MVQKDDNEADNNSNLKKKNNSHRNFVTLWMKFNSSPFIDFKSWTLMDTAKRREKRSEEKIHFIS